MGLEERDGQNGYLPDASTSSYDVAAVPSDTSYDRDPEARATVAPLVHSHNSDEATAVSVCGRWSTYVCAGAAVTVLECLHQHLCLFQQGPFVALVYSALIWPLCDPTVGTPSALLPSKALDSPVQH